MNNKNKNKRTRTVYQCHKCQKQCEAPPTTLEFDYIFPADRSVIKLCKSCYDRVYRYAWKTDRQK